MPYDADPDNFEDGMRIRFADPGGRSALRAAGPGNRRIYACPNCKTKNKLTRADKLLGYQCNACADKAEGGLD